MFFTSEHFFQNILRSRKTFCGPAHTTLSLERWKTDFLRRKQRPQNLRSPFEPYILLIYPNGERTPTSCFALQADAARGMPRALSSRILWGVGGLFGLFSLTWMWIHVFQGTSGMKVRKARRASRDSAFKVFRTQSKTGVWRLCA